MWVNISLCSAALTQIYLEKSHLYITPLQSLCVTCLFLPRTKQPGPEPDLPTCSIWPSTDMSRERSGCHGSKSRQQMRRWIFCFSCPVHWVAAVSVLKHGLSSYILTPDRQTETEYSSQSSPSKCSGTELLAVRSVWLLHMSLCLPGANDQGVLVININTWPVKAWPSPPTCIHTHVTSY